MNLRKPPQRTRHRLDEELAYTLRMAYIKMVGIVLVVAVLPATLMIWMQSRQTTNQLRQSQIAACKRALEDRKQNLQGWQTATQARQQAANNARNNAERQFNEDAVQRYITIVRSLDSRAHINCQQAVK